MSVVKDLIKLRKYNIHEVNEQIFRSQKNTKPKDNNSENPSIEKTEDKNEEISTTDSTQTESTVTPRNNSGTENQDTTVSWWRKVKIKTKIRQDCHFSWIIPQGGKYWYWNGQSHCNVKEIGSDFLPWSSWMKIKLHMSNTPAAILVFYHHWLLDLVKVWVRLFKSWLMLTQD